MTIIKATCPCCGDVELTRDQVRLMVHPVNERSFYVAARSAVTRRASPPGPR